MSIKRLTREEKRRVQHRRALLGAIGWIAFVLFIGILLGSGVTAAMLKAAETSQIRPEETAAAVPELMEPTAPTEEIVEAVATNDSSLDTLELVGTFTATAYCPCVKCCGIWSAEHPDRPEGFVQQTASGTTPEEGRTIAADWDVLPAGSEVVINGHTYTVEDTGAAVKGNRVDIYFEDHNAARVFGVQEVEVYRETK